MVLRGESWYGCLIECKYLSFNLVAQHFFSTGLYAIEVFFFIYFFDGSVLVNNKTSVFMSVTSLIHYFLSIRFPPFLFLLSFKGGETVRGRAENNEEEAE